MLIPALLSRFDDYCRRSGRKPGGVSDLLFGDGKKITLLRQGRDITTGVLERAHLQLDQLFAELDAQEAERQAMAGHGANLADATGDCDCNGAGELRRGGVVS